MPNYDFTSALSSIDFERLSKDLLEAELGVRFENFREGRDGGIDLRYAPAEARPLSNSDILRRKLGFRPEIIVQCKRYSKYSDLKSVLKRKELPKVIKLNPRRYVLTTSVPLSPQQADDLREILSPYVISTDDIYGRERLNALLDKHPEVERRHLKLWISSAGVLDSILHARTYSVSREELERTLSAAKLYVKNQSFEEALQILKKHHVCIVSGIPGIGKTTLARMLLLYFYRQEYEIIKIESDISEARDVPFQNLPRFYYYDDFLGQTAQADKLNKNEDQKLLDFMTSVRDSKHARFVLTTREYILNQARLHYEKLAREKLDYRTCVMDLSKYSRRIRAEILYNHLHFSPLTRGYVQALISGRGYLKIVDHRNYNPRLVEYLTDPQWVGTAAAGDYLALFIRNLDNPALVWEHAFDHQIAEESRDLLLVLTTMPTESRLVDVELAFEAFQRHQDGVRRRQTIQRMLKELEGTFISTRLVGETVLLQFQNPSIRDFMVRRLLQEPLRQDVLLASVFFEQAQWFAEILFDERRFVRPHVAAQFGARVATSLKRLADAQSCTIEARRQNGEQVARVQEADRAMRLGVIAAFTRTAGAAGEDEFIRARLLDLEQALQNDQLSPASCLVTIEPLRQLGILSEPCGVSFADALKTKAIQASDIEEFRALGELTERLPELFPEAERRDLSESFSAFVAQFVEDYENDELGVDEPDVVREDALALETLGEIFGTDTQEGQRRLNAYADQMEEKIEEQRDRSWDDERGSGSGGSASECSDGELDSMFETLSE
jgi:hypothetical protein